jgi:ribosomal protein S18 acetylase RimI-like enzyme
VNVIVVMTVIEGTLEDIPQITSWWDGIDSLSKPPDPRREVPEWRPPLGSVLIGKQAGNVVAGAAVAFDGHQGWIYAVWVEPEVRQQGLGRLIVSEAEAWLLKRGAETVQLQIRYSNLAVLRFFEKLGYRFQDIVVLGKSLRTEQ